MMSITLVLRMSAQFSLKVRPNTSTVAPGFIRTAEVEAWYTEKARRRGLPTDWASVEKMIVEREFPNPCGRIALPEDVAALVCFLAGDTGAFINGQHLRVDGGALETLF